MVKIKNYEIPNTAEELTIEQLDKLNHITRREDLDNIEKYIEKFTYLGVPEDEFDNMDFSDFKNYIKEFESSTVPTDKVTEIEIEGFKYIAPEVIRVKDLGLIEKVWKSNIDSFSSEMMAVLFKREDLSKTEHYTPAHLKHKAKLFKEQKAVLAMPYIVDVLTQLTKTSEKIANEPTEELDASQG